MNSFISNVVWPNSKRAPARSVQLEAVYLEASLYINSSSDLNITGYKQAHCAVLESGSEKASK